MYVTDEVNHLTKSLQQSVSQIKILSNKILPRRMYVTDEVNHLTKSLQQGVSQIKILSNKIPPRRMYVTDEVNHVTKSLQQGVSQIKILSSKIPPRRMYVTDEPKHLAKSLQQGVSQTKLLKLPVSHHDECILLTKAFGKASISLIKKRRRKQAKTKANNLTTTFTSKSPLNIGQHTLFSKQIKLFQN